MPYAPTPAAARTRRHRPWWPWAMASCLGLLAGMPAAAQYVWKDARGQVHASDQPPPRDIPDRDVIRRPTGTRPAAAPAAAPAPASAASAAAAAASRTPVDAELQQRRTRAEAEAKAKAQADEQRAAAQRADNCRRARQTLATLESGARVVRMNERGERVVLEDGARAQEIAQARGVVGSDCR